MKRSYVFIPSILMLAFLAYYRWWAPRMTTFHFVGESPQWSPQQAVTLHPPPVTGESGDEYEGRNGAREALEDLHAGKVVLLGYGLPYPWDAELKEIWKREFDVDSRSVAGCMVTESLVAYMSGYNRVMHAHIVQRFGSDVSRIVFHKARALYNERQLQKG